MPPKTSTVSSPKSSRVPPNQTVALCGIRSDATNESIQQTLKDEGLLTACLEVSGIGNLIKDKKDTEHVRRLVFLSCKSQDAANKICKALNKKKVDALGMDKYGHELQAVLKNDLASVSWTKAVTKTVEGPIATKRNIDCFIDHPMR